MTTVTLTIDEELLQRAKIGLEQRGLTLDNLFTNALSPYSEGEECIRAYEGLLRRHFFLRPTRPYIMGDTKEPPLLAPKPNWQK